MHKIGLTGGIGSGKSTVAKILAEYGWVVVDADDIARRVVEPGQPALAELAEAFGHDIVKRDGSLDRALLAERAFATPASTDTLNSITHPRIAQRTAAEFAQADAEGAKFAVYDMPLLVDKGLHKDMDATIVVDVDVDTRIERLVHHRGLGVGDARRRVGAQIDDATRRAAADYLIDNDGSPAQLRPQVEEVVAKLQRRFRG